MAGKSFETETELPVVLRLKQHSKPHRIRNAGRKSQGWRWSVDHLLVLSAMPLAAVVIMICWQLTSSPESAISHPLHEQPTTLPTSAGEIDVQSKMVPTHTAESPSKPPASREYSEQHLPILPPPELDSLRPTGELRAVDANALRSAKCTANDEPAQTDGTDRHLVRIQSVRACLAEGTCSQQAKLISAGTPTQNESTYENE